MANSAANENRKYQESHKSFTEKDDLHSERPDEREKPILRTVERNESRKDVRAGPGDAGASDRPEQLPDNPQTERRRREARPLIIGFLIACIAAIIVMLLL